MSVMVLPASCTRREPLSTLSTEAPIRVLISRAASAERPARLRTSPATTAKPRPCSPARAASTAALSARMLVWKAMPSMTPMMSAMRRDAVWISSMVLTTWDTASPPRRATALAEPANWFACAAASAFWRTELVSCVIDEAVSCRLPAACSVRWDRSWLPVAISALALAMLPAAWRTWVSEARSFSTICTRLPCSSPISSCRSCGGGVDRSPSATLPATREAWRRACTSWRSTRALMTMAVTVSSTLSRPRTSA